MKRALLHLAFIFLPIFALAQDDAPTIKEFGKKIEGIAHTFKLDDHTAILQLRVDKGNFEVVAVDDKLQEKWRSPFPGDAIGAGKFHGHILAVAARDNNDHTTDYTGFLIDEKTGKLLAQKLLYQSKSEYRELPAFFLTEDGSAFKILFEETKIKKTGLFKGNDLKSINGLTIADIGDKLVSTNTQIPIPDGDYLNSTFNAQGDLFIVSLQDDKTVRADRYPAGKTAPETPIIEDIGLLKVDGNYIENYLAGVNYSHVISSGTDKNVIYFAYAYKNTDKDRQVSLVKFNFNNHTAQLASEIFDKKHTRELEKSFVPLDKKMPKADLGRYSGILIEHLEERNGLLILVLTDRYIDQYTMGESTTPNAANTVHYIQGNAILVDAFDLKLQPKFEQLIPITFRMDKLLRNVYHGDGSKYYVLAANYAHKWAVAYATVDLNSGQLIKFEQRDHDKHFVDGEAIWLKDNFIIPFLTYPSIISARKENVDLQLISY